MKTITIALYSFDELKKETQDKAVELLHDLNLEHEWWKSTYEDAERIGLKITSFDLDRANYCHGLFLSNGYKTANLILEEHGDGCTTYHTAKKFLEDYKPKKEEFEKENPGWDFTYQDEGSELEQEFLKALLKDYLRILKQEVQYRESKEAIIESIKANDYLFFEDGKLIPVKYYAEAKEVH